MRVYTEYEILHALSPDDLTTLVLAAIEEEMEPYGTPFSFGGEICQAIVRCGGQNE